MADINISDLDLSKFVKDLDATLDPCEIPTLKDIEGNMKVRIHNKGKDSGNDTISTRYSSEWAGVRRSRGRQTGYVDLEFEGDLRRDLTVGRSGGENALGFKNTFQNEKAKTNELRYKKEIWTPTDNEVKRASKVFEKRVSKKLSKIVDRL